MTWEAPKTWDEAHLIRMFWCTSYHLADQDEEKFLVGGYLSMKDAAESIQHMRRGQGQATAEFVELTSDSKSEAQLFVSVNPGVTYRLRGFVTHMMDLDAIILRLQAQVGDLSQRVLDQAAMYA